MRCSFAIDCFPASASRYVDSHAIVAVDVIRATTTVVTAAAAGWRCFPVARLDQAIAMQRKFPDALLMGELGGNMPDGFHMNNSPAKLLARRDKHRPLIVLSTSGTDLLSRSRDAEAVYPACFRNFGALATHIAETHDRVALIGAGSRNEFREEDQICCAWIAQRLLDAGCEPENRESMEIAQRWQGAGADSCLVSHSADYLIRSDQMDDLEFVLNHVNDLDSVFQLIDDEILPVGFGALADAA